MASERAVGTIPVFKKDDEILFCLVQHLDGHWGFPKGHTQEGESDMETALRELKEETGVQHISLEKDLMYSEHYSFVRGGETVDKEVDYFFGFVDSPERKTGEMFKEEIVNVLWMPYEEARMTITFAESRETLDKVWEYLKNRLE